MANIIRNLAVLYLVAITCFGYGWLAVELKIFPYPQLEPYTSEIIAFFAESDKDSLAEIVQLDHQERKNQFDFTGLKIDDRDFADDGFVLMSRYSKEHGVAVVELYSLAEQKVLHRWQPDLDAIFERAPRFTTGINTRQAYRSQHPLLLDNGDLLVTSGEGPLVRVNPCGEVVWLINRHFHHSIERMANGHFLVPVVVREGENESGIKLRSDGFAEVSSDGRIVREYALYEPLMAAGYRGLIYGVGTFEHDRFHLNDVQPVPGQPDKVLLSIRNLSSVAQFDMTTGAVDWLKTGPWINQHDINALEDGWVSVFGNDFVRGAWKFPQPGFSQVYRYHPDTGEVDTPYSEMLGALSLRSEYEGRAEILDNGDVFIEETNRDRMLRLSKTGVRWQFVSPASDTTTGALHWSRYLQRDTVTPQLLENLQCPDA
jgi:Arylsulfotransferase (ASST)